MHFLTDSTDKEMFARKVIFAKKRLKDVFAATLKIRDSWIIYLHQSTAEISPFREGFISAKLRIGEVSRKNNLRENF